MVWYPPYQRWYCPSCGAYRWGFSKSTERGREGSHGVRAPIQDVEESGVAIHFQELFAYHRGAVPVAERVRGPHPVARVSDVPQGLFPVDEAGVHRVQKKFAPRFFPVDHDREVDLGPPPAAG